MKILRRVLICALVVAVSLAMLGLALFRIPLGRAIEEEGVAYLKKVELSVDLREDFFECPLGKKKLYLNGNRVLYVSSDDWKKVWGDQPMRKIKFRTYPVLMGLGAARIIHAEPLRSSFQETANQQPGSARFARGSP